MGYYSSFTVHADGFKSVIEVEDFASALNNRYNRSWKNFSWNPLVFLDSTQETKWYDWQKDLSVISGMFPDILIEIERSGEETPDFEKLRARNGKIEVVRGTVVYPEFKEIV